MLYIGKCSTKNMCYANGLYKSGPVERRGLRKKFECTVWKIFVQLLLILVIPTFSTNCDASNTL
jgi:hypothetical protein